MGQLNVRISDELEEMFKLSVPTGKRNKFFVDCIKDHLSLNDDDEINNLLNEFNQKEAKIRIEKIKALENFRKEKLRKTKFDKIKSNNIKMDLKDKLKEADF